MSQHKKHMEQNCLLPIMSSAYRQGHSTESALLKVQADILQNMEQQWVTLLVLIDLSAAFNTVDHPILFQCLEEWFGFHDSVLSWYKSYLSDRKQCIILNGMRSNILHLPFGVPQGSCLGPVLFTQYASSLFDIFNKHLICAHAYANDHQLYTDFSANQVSLKEAVTRMESCLQDVKSWMILNKLKMNDSKTECILIGSYQQLAKINLTSISVGEHRITVLQDIRNLGAYFDKNLVYENPWRYQMHSSLSSIVLPQKDKKIFVSSSNWITHTCLHFQSHWLLQQSSKWCIQVSNKETPKNPKHGNQTCLQTPQIQPYHTTTYKSTLASCWVLH